MVRVLFVCLGNICRSPMAEGVFKKMIVERGLQKQVSCDSAGISNYHVGNEPDERMQDTAAQYDVPLESIARQVTEEDLQAFDYILAMDRENYDELLWLGQTMKDLSHVRLMREFDPETKAGRDIDEVPDPYFGGIDGFEQVYQILERSSKAFIDYLEQEHKLKGDVRQSQ